MIVSRSFARKRIALTKLNVMTRESVSELCRYAYWLCGNWATAESLVDVALTSSRLTHLMNGKDDGKLLRRVIAALRKEHRRRQDEPIGRSANQSVDREYRGVARTGVERLRIGIASLPTEYREPLVLQGLGYSAEDIATLLELTTANVVVRLTHARRQLLMRPNFDDEQVE